MSVPHQPNPAVLAPDALVGLAKFGAGRDVAKIQMKIGVWVPVADDGQDLHVSSLEVHKSVASAESDVINISARSGIAGQAGRAAYCASKGGAITLTEAMAMDHAADKIRVNCICPGPTRTPMVDTSTPERLARYATRVPMGRSGEPEDIAQAALYLASDEASHVTAAILPVDGGMRLTGA